MRKERFQKKLCFESLAKGGQLRPTRDERSPKDGVTLLWVVGVASGVWDETPE